MSSLLLRCLALCPFLPFFLGCDLDSTTEKSTQAHGHADRQHAGKQETRLTPTGEEQGQRNALLCSCKHFRPIPYFRFSISI